MAFVLVAGYLLIAVLPSVAADATRIALTTPEPSAVDWTVADASRCASTAASLGWPPEGHFPKLLAVGVGTSDEVERARPEALAAADALLKAAASKQAPGAEAQLDALVATVKTAGAAWAAPITATEFRREVLDLSDGSRL